MGDDARRPDRLFDSRIDLHDRQHFEVTFNYDVSLGATAPDGRARFLVDAYFFLPTNLGISALSYGKDDFFKDVFSYLRYKTPTLDRAALSDPLNPQSPLNVLSFNLKQLVDQPHREASLERRCVHEAKLLGCILIANWRDRRKEAQALAAAVGAPGPEAQAVRAEWARSLEDEHDVLVRYRALRVAYGANRSQIGSEVHAAFRMVDEYLTYRFDEHMAKLHDVFGPLMGASADDLERTCHALGSREVQYRREQGFTVLKNTVPSTLEQYTYRTGALKKALGEVLYLDVETVRVSQRFRGWLAAVGAALAAFWSTLGDRNVNIRLHGVSTAMLILIIVLVYVLKDRLKDWVKEYLAGQMQRYLPDQRLTILDPTSRTTVGTCRQTVHYEQASALPEDIRRVREFSRTLDVDLQRREEVLRYRQRVTLEARTLNSLHDRRVHVKHILRYSVENLLKRLSDPYSHVPHYNADLGRFESVLAPKVYHVNVVFRVSRLGANGHASDPVYHRVRAVLTQDGIDRLEPLVQNTDLWDLDAVARLMPDPEVLHQAEAEDFSPG